MNKQTRDKRPAKEDKVLRSAADVLQEFVLPERLERFETVIAARTDSLTIVLDGVRNYHNISAVMRSADAFGLSTVHLVGDEFQYSRGVSLGTERWLQLQRHKTAATAAEVLLKDGFQLVTLEPPAHCPESIPVVELPFQRRLALVFGAEKAGVSPEFVNAATIRAHVPMYGFVDSFNVSVAAAICLFCSTISGAQPKRQVETLGPGRKAQLLNEWLQKDVRGADLILKEVGEDEPD